jgi:membrane protease YdiL (CAAX protease family)
MINTSVLISDRRRIIEIGAVFLTGAGKFIFMDWLQWKLPFIVFAILVWSAYVFIRQRQVPYILKYWGFRTDNFKQVIRLVLPFGITSVIVFLMIGFYLGTINITWHIFPILLFYPIWGTIQQFLVIGIVAGNLKDLKQRKFPNHLIIFITALLFGILHYPFYWLILGTFLLALFYGYIYLKTRNVFVMGIFHGWLGALFFYTVVGRDPFTEVFGNISS